LHKLSYKLLIHDIDEAIYCDIPRSFKYHNKALTAEIKNTVDKIVAEQYDEELVRNINDSKGLHDIESIFVKSIDVLQAGFKIYEEYKLYGNYHFKDRLAENIRYQEDMINTLNNVEIEGVKELVIILKDLKDSFVESAVLNV